MNKFLIYVLLVTCYLLRVTGARAISPTPEATPTGVRQIKEQVKEIREAVKEKVREKIEEIRLGKKMAYGGEIKEITSSIITLDTRTGNNQVKISEETVFIGKGGKNVKLEDLEIGNFCIAMGYLAENNVLEAKRIVVITKPKLIHREVAIGRVTDISSEEKILTVKNERKGITYTVSVTEKTMITKKLATRVERAKFSDIEIGDRVVAIGTVTENEEKIITAKIIHIIPSQKPSPSPTPEE